MMRKVGILVLVLLAALSGACAEAPSAALTITAFDMGSADAILIQTASGAVLVDAGLDRDGDALVRSLQERGVTALDVLIITHFDKDHVGGADAVLAAIPVKAVVQPGYEKDSKQFEQYMDALAAAGVEPVTLTENAAFEVDGAGYAIDVANQAFYGEDEENDYSLVVRLTVGTARALLAGDAENPRLAELIDEGDLKAGVLKVPHHGRYEKLSAPFFAMVGAEYAIVTSSADEPEDAETLQALRMAGSRVLLTREGTVTLTTDGKTWSAAQ